MFLPTQLGPASTWSISDFGEKWVTSRPATGGIASAEVATVPQDELWLVDFVRVSADPIPVDTDVRSYVCHDTVDWDVMGTSTGQYDVADMNSPIHVRGGTVLLLAWRDMPDGAVGRGYVQWTVMRQGGGA